MKNQLNLFPEPIIAVNLNDYDFVVVNSSGGKDSVCALWFVWELAKAQRFPIEKMVVSHQDLGDMEWPGVKELVQRQADKLGMKAMYTKRRTAEGKEETILDYAERRGKWPSNKQRWCTSDFKRGPGGRVVTSLTKGMAKSKVLYVFGFRADESPARRKKEVFKLNTNLTTKSREVYDWLPIHHWDLKMVWDTIRGHDLPYHYAYDLGMPRLSCMFCIFSPLDALVIAGRANPELLDRYIETEKKIGHDFRDGFKIETVKEKIKEGHQPVAIKDWVM